MGFVLSFLQNRAGLLSQGRLWYCRLLSRSPKKDYYQDIILYVMFFFHSNAIRNRMLISFLVKTENKKESFDTYSMYITSALYPTASGLVVYVDASGLFPFSKWHAAIQSLQNMNRQIKKRGKKKWKEHSASPQEKYGRHIQWRWLTAHLRDLPWGPSL